MLEYSQMNSDFEAILAKHYIKYRRLSYNKRDILIRGDDDPVGVLILKEGVVKMCYVNKEGVEITLNLFKPGAAFPMSWAIGGIENNYNYQALTAVKVLKVGKDEFVDLMQKNPELLFELTKKILIGLDGLVFNIRHLVGGTSVSKVATILYMLSLRFGKKQGDYTEIDLPVSHQDIANYAGLARETVTILINKFLKEGILTQIKRKIVVVDMDKLKANI